jgi:hypothetical protein
VSVARPPRTQSAPIFLFSLLLASLLIGAAAVSVARAEDGAGLSVEVIDSSASATPTGTTTPTPTPTFSTTVGGVSTTDTGAGTNAAGGGTGAGTAQPGSSTSPSGPSDSSVAGVLYVSGLAWTYTPSLNPLDGSLNLRFTVRNVYRETLSPTATLWITQIFGGPVDVPVIVAVDKLAPGETRTVEANFHGLAQWTVLSAHATLAVPGKGQMELAPIGRDAMIWFLPWFVVLLVAVGAAWILWRRVRPGLAASAAGAGPVPGPPGATVTQGTGPVAQESGPLSEGTSPTREAP